MKVLLTGDDGYKALGLRIMARVLQEKKFDVRIAATLEERSSTGGSFPGKGTWGRDTVEGVEAIWVSGTPADSVELAKHVYGTDFDFVVSGANLGENVGLISPSGTIGAASHGLDAGVAPRALAVSWDCPRDMENSGEKMLTVDEFAMHPMATMARILDVVLENNFWGAGFLNCNLPHLKPKKLRLCSPAARALAEYYGFTFQFDEPAGTYQKIPGPSHQLEGDLSVDAVALSRGFATIVPWMSNRYVNADILALIGTEITL